MYKVYIKINKLILFLSAIIALSFSFYFSSFAENINITYNYGIKNVAKNFNDLPIFINIENKDSQVFNGYLTLNVFENNNSIYTYRIDVSIPEKSIASYSRSISISNQSNTVVFNVYNKREEIVTSERINIDLSYYIDRLLIGAISYNHSDLSYMDNANIEKVNVQTKLTEVNIDDIVLNKKTLNVLDMLIISGMNDGNDLEKIEQALYSFVSNGKPIIICLDNNNKYDSIPSFLENYVHYNRANVREPYTFDGSYKIYDENKNILANSISIGDGYVIFVNSNFNQLSKQNDASRSFVKLLERCIDSNYFIKISNSYNARINSDYYNISNLLNMIDRHKLPDIFMLTILLVFYVLFLTLILYVFLRNINKREQYGKVAAIFSIIYTFIMFSIGYSIMKKNTFLTYLSIVNIKDSNAKEMAFLNFRTSESGSYTFDTNKDNSINPILKNNKEPIVSFNFINRSETKSTTFEELDDRTHVSVENAKDFDSNVFVYENNNYLNDIYNIDASFKRYNGEIVGRITNNMSQSNQNDENMNITLKNASLLLHGKILKIGDIESNHSISLSRSNAIGTTINNNAMLADIIADENSRNIVKYYLDENVLGYYDYGLLFGFIDDNLTIDINSSDVGEVYGRTLIVTKVDNDYMIMNDNSEDYSSLENEVNTIEGNYDILNNTTDGNSVLINEYSFDRGLDIKKLYIEKMDSYDYGQIEFDVPFYGTIEIYNRVSKTYETFDNASISEEKVTDYIDNNKIILRFSEMIRDPLYRKISVPILRAIASKW